MNPALDRAIAHFDSLADMARQMGVTYQAVQQWQKQGKVPSDRCTRLAELTGESREDLVGWNLPDVTDIAAASDDTQGDAGGEVDPDEKV